MNPPGGARRAAKSRFPIRGREFPKPSWRGCSQQVEARIAAGRTDVYRRAREQVHRLVILRAMQQAGGNRNRAAEILGLSRVTLAKPNSAA